MRVSFEILDYRFYDEGVCIFTQILLPLMEYMATSWQKWQLLEGMDSSIHPKADKWQAGADGTGLDIAESYSQWTEEVYRPIEFNFFRSFLKNILLKKS